MPVKTPEEIGNHFIKEVWISTGIELELSQGEKQLPSWGLCDDLCCVANEHQALCNTSFLIHAAGPREARRGPWTWVSSCAAGWDRGEIDRSSLIRQLIDRPRRLIDRSSLIRQLVDRPH